jgi:hypothetical protein
MGGLGNQLFQFSHATNLALVTGRRLIFDTGSYLTDELRNSQLAFLGLEPNISYVVSASNNVLDFSPEDDPCECPEINLDEKNFHFENINIPNVRFKLQGYWQSERYFFANRELIQSYLRERLIDPIAKDVAAIFHIRLGDMFKNPEVLAKHGVLDSDFYLEAYKLLTPVNRIDVISDSPELIQTKYLDVLSRKLPDVEFFHETSNNILGDFSKLGHASEIVLANSTFSWWGAYLSDATRIIAPRNVFTDSTLRELNTCDYYPKQWVLI